MLKGIDNRRIFTFYPTPARYIPLLKLGIETTV